MPENKTTIKKTEGRTGRKGQMHPAWEASKFKAGQSGNPGGRPKKKPVTEMYEEILNDPKAIALLRKSVVKALSRGQMAMVLQLREMTDRIEGKVVQPIEADVTVSLSDAIAAARKRAGSLGEGRISG